MKTFIPEQFQIVEGLTPAADAAGRTGEYVNLENCTKATCVIHITQGNAATIALSLVEATSHAAGGSQAISATFPIYVCQTAGTAAPLAKQTNAASFTTSAALTHKVVVFEVDPAILSDGFTHVAVVTGASNAANITEALWYLECTTQAATLPEALV